MNSAEETVSVFLYYDFKLGKWAGVNLEDT